MIIKAGETVPFAEVPHGVPCKIPVNVPMGFKIELLSGSVVEGMITPNNPLTLTSTGDIVKISLVALEKTFKKPELIKKAVDPGAI